MAFKANTFVKAEPKEEEATHTVAFDSEGKGYLKRLDKSPKVEAKEEKPKKASKKKR